MIVYLNGIYISLIILSWNILCYSNDWKSNFTVNNVICTSKKCYDYAKYIESYMNRNIDPCNDFYEFVCGRKKNPLPHYYPVWSTAAEMSIKSAKDIKYILEEEPSNEDSPKLRKAKKLYKACMELPSLGMINANMAFNYIQDAGYFPLYSASKSGSQKKKLWPEIHSYYLSLTGDAGLFDIFTNGYKSNNYEPLLHIIDIYTPFAKISFKKVCKGSTKELYEKYLKAVLFSVFSYGLLKVYPKVLTARIQSIVNFRCEIIAIKALHPRTQTEPLPVDIMTVSELEKWYSLLAAQYHIPTVPWVETIYLMYKKTRSKEQIENMPVAIINRLYHEALMNLIHETPNDVIVNHMHMYFIEKHLEFNNLLHGMLIDTILVNGKLKGSVLYHGKNWHSCILANPLDETIGKAYIQKYFPPEKKRKIQDFVAELKDVLLLEIRESKWLDAFLMNKFSHIVDDLKVAIGYPEYYDNEHLRVGYNPIVDPGKVEAFYCANDNRLSISAASLQLPLYDPELPKTILYASVGVLISHELYHAFCPEAVVKCYTFTIPRSKKLLYNERVNCFYKKYNKLPVKELKFLNPPPTIDGSRTLDENIADAMGLKLAYHAFRKDGWENEQCAILPIRGLTCEKLFFIVFASVFCSDSQADVLLEEVMLEDHSTARVRVNEAVSNMNEFARAFDCPKKASMNPIDKCDLWR